MNKKRIEILVGLFVLVGAMGLLFLALKAANLATFVGGDTYVLHARFDNIGGLKVRAAVRSAGVKVGRVTAISLDPATYQGIVTMEISKGVDFPRDSSVKILTAGLLGDQYVGFEPGGDEKFFVAGDVIKQTQSAIVLETLISKVLFDKAADAGSQAGDKVGDKK